MLNVPPTDPATRCPITHNTQFALGFFCSDSLTPMCLCVAFFADFINTIETRRYGPPLLFPHTELLLLVCGCVFVCVSGGGFTRRLELVWATVASTNRTQCSTLSVNQGISLARSALVATFFVSSFKCNPDDLSLTGKQ